MIKSLGVFTLICLLVMSSSAIADEKVTVNVHASSAQLLAHELVYSGSEKVSELIWDTKSASLLGVDVHWSLNPEGSVHANLSYATTISKASSVMDDYDWLVVGADWSDWSHHENTSLNSGTIIDMSLSEVMYKSEENNAVIDFLLGFRQDRWLWQAKGGSFIYTSNPTNTFRDLTGTFSDIPVIRYELIMDAPYVGLEGKWNHGQFTLGAKLIVSAMASVKDVDNHHLRDLVFTGRSINGNMFGADVNIAYALSNHSAFSLKYHVQSYTNNRGNIVEENQLTGGKAYHADAAGMSLDYNTISLAYSKQF